MIKRRSLIDGLSGFLNYRDHMIKISKEKKEYHKVLINSIVNRYMDPIEARSLIDARMADE